MATDIKIENIKANGFEFVCRTVGTPSDGEAVVLLHGFPETSHMWEETMQHLHQQGFYCIAPDMRGYSPNARPKGVKNYGIEAIVNDIIAIAAAKNIKQFHLIGHDWGAAIGWAITGIHPDKITSWIAMSVPHIKALAEAVKTDPEQKKMSGYARTFQLKLIPELALKANDFKRLKKECWYLSSPEQIKAYKAVFSQKNALTAVLNYYRNNWNKMERIATELRVDAIETPTTFIWGNKDVALGRKGVEGTPVYMKGPYELVELDASHWLIQDAKEEVLKAIDKHLNAYAKQ